MTTVSSAVMTHGFLLNGRWITSGEDISIRSPYDGAVVGATFRDSSADLETAIVSSVRAFEITRKMPPFERQRILNAVSAKLSERREEIARCIALEAGKPVRTARAERQNDGLHAPRAQNGRGLRGGGVAIDLDAGQQFGFGFVRCENRDVAQELIRQRPGGRRIENHARAGFGREEGSGLHGLQRYLQLHHHHAGIRDRPGAPGSAPPLLPHPVNIWGQAPNIHSRSSGRPGGRPNSPQNIARRVYGPRLALKWCSCLRTWRRRSPTSLAG